VHVAIVRVVFVGLVRVNIVMIVEMRDTYSGDHRIEAVVPGAGAN
jgi:hypothetical protein